MANLKTLNKALAESLAARKATQATIRAGEEVTQANLANKFVVPEEVLEEYHAEQALLDGRVPVPTNEVQEEVRQAVILERDTARRTAIQGDTKDVNLDHQAISPDEFRGRLGQFRDEEYSNNVIGKGESQQNMFMPEEFGLPPKTINDRYDIWERDSFLTDKQAFGRPTRTAAALQEWGREGVYKRNFFGKHQESENPMIFYHTDIKTDPRGLELPLIQFDVNANEFGLHIGSKQSGQDINSKGVLDSTKARNDAVSGVFEELSMGLKTALGEDVPADLIYREAFQEVRKNLFLRYGEKPFPTPSNNALEDVIDDFFGEIMQIVRDKSADSPAGLNFSIDDPLSSIKGVPNAEALKKRLHSTMRTTLDPTQHPIITNVKQGLHVQDLGANTAHNIANDQFGRGVFNDDELQAIIGTKDNATQNKMLRELLTENGYDHLIYHNMAEDKGVVSLVLFDDTTYQNLHNPTVGKSTTAGSETAYATLLAPLAALFGEEDADIRDNQ